MNTLFTIGYGGRSPVELASLLKSNHIEIVVDVRAVPRSRIPGFNKMALSRSLQAEGINYQHMEALGNVNRKADIGAPVILVDERRGLDELMSLMQTGRVAIMCAEKNYHGCHRTYIAEKIKNQNSEFRVHNI